MSHMIGKMNGTGNYNKTHTYSITSGLGSVCFWGFTSSFVRAKLNKQNFKLDEQTKLALKFFKHPGALSVHEVVQPVERSFSVL